jgi:hypothetical protein
MFRNAVGSADSGASIFGAAVPEPEPLAPVALV